MPTTKTGEKIFQNKFIFYGFGAFLPYNLYMDNKQQNEKMVQDKKTGQWYNPEKEFQKLLNSDWFKRIMVRMKEK